MDTNPLSLRGKLKGHVPREQQELVSNKSKFGLNARLTQSKWELIE
jgi:hypothetical protein